MPFAHRTPSSIRSCRSDDSLQRVAEVMWKHDRDYLLIVDTDGRPIGIITAQQLFLAARKQDKPLAHIRVSSAVSGNAIAGVSTQLVPELGQHSSRSYLHQVPIFDVEDCLVNIVRADWLARYLSELQSTGSSVVLDLPPPGE